MGAGGGAAGVGRKEVGGKAVDEEGCEDEGAEGAEGEGDGSVMTSSRRGSEGGRWTAMVNAVGCRVGAATGRRITWLKMRSSEGGRGGVGEGKC